MSKIKDYFSAILLCSFLFIPTLFAEETAARVELVTESEHISSGALFRVGVRITASGSHIYWKNPGEVGAPLALHWRLPKGFHVEEEHWPAPRVFEENGSTFFGYDDTVFIIADIRAPQHCAEEVSIGVYAQWLACGSLCVPGEAELELRLPFKDTPPLLNLERVTEFTQALQQKPQVITNRIQVASKENVLLFQLDEGVRADRAWFASEGSDQLIAYAESPVSGKIRLQVQGEKIVRNQPLRGVLVLEDNSNQTAYIVQTAPIKEARQTMLWFIIAAFVGGILLNIMPCVLPLITLKVYGLIKASGDGRSSSLLSGLWFTLGVVGCFWALAGIAGLLKFLGHQIGWGFQLQEPMFVAVLVLVFFLFALSSLGVFEVGTLLASAGGSFEGKAAGAFLNGVLATLVTTPCTGPFLGSILGMVMSLSFLNQLLIFSAIGCGMALPYLIFSIFPQALRVLPKPGAWMQSFKQITGFMLLGTATWLLWIFGAQTSVTSVIIVLAGLWGAGVGAWIAGIWGTPIVSRGKRRAAWGVFTALIAGALALSWIASSRIDQPTSIEHGAWQPFSREKLQELRREGRAVFVNFTAKWCLTCQVNKAILYAEEVQERFKALDIVMLEADWTRKDPGITEELAQLGRASVPSYVYYPADRSDPVILPEKISQTILEDLVFSDIFSLVQD